MEGACLQRDHATDLAPRISISLSPSVRRSPLKVPSQDGLLLPEGPQSLWIYLPWACLLASRSVVRVGFRQ